MGLMNVALMVIGPAVNRKDVWVAVQDTDVRFAAVVFVMGASPMTRYAVPSTTTDAYHPVTC